MNSSPRYVPCTGFYSGQAVVGVLDKERNKALAYWKGNEAIVEKALCQLVDGSCSVRESAWMPAHSFVHLKELELVSE